MIDEDDRGAAPLRQLVEHPHLPVVSVRDPREAVLLPFALPDLPRHEFGIDDDEPYLRVTFEPRLEELNEGELVGKLLSQLDVALAVDEMHPFGTAVAK